MQNCYFEASKYTESMQEIAALNLWKNWTKDYLIKEEENISNSITLDLMIEFLV